MVYLGYESALRYWLTKRAGEWLPDATPERTLSRAEGSARRARAAWLPFGPERGRPLHLMVANQSERHAASDIVAHLWSKPLPARSLCLLEGDARVASPELTFVQMAANLPFVALVEAGLYLCGSFAVKESGRGYAERRQAVTNAASLAAYLDALPPRTYGAKKARQALGFVIDGAASPMEVFLIMSYTLPYEVGGRLHLSIQANQRIEIDEPLQRLLGSRHLVGDLALSDRQADLEYDSDEFHTGSYRLDHTQARRNVLEAMNIKTISATYGQVRTPERFDDFTWMLEHRLGLEHPEYTTRQLQAQNDLHDFLLDPRRTLF